MYLLLLQNPVQIAGVGTALLVITGNGAGSVQSPVTPPGPGPSSPGWTVVQPTPALWVAEAF